MDSLFLQYIYIFLSLITAIAVSIPAYYKLTENREVVTAGFILRNWSFSLGIQNRGKYKIAILRTSWYLLHNRNLINYIGGNQSSSSVTYVPDNPSVVGSDAGNNIIGRVIVPGETCSALFEFGFLRHNRHNHPIYIITLPKEHPLFGEGLKKIFFLVQTTKKSHWFETSFKSESTKQPCLDARNEVQERDSYEWIQVKPLKPISIKGRLLLWEKKIFAQKA